MNYYQNLWKALQEQKERYQKHNEGDLIEVYAGDIITLINIAENLQSQIDNLDSLIRDED